MLGETNLRMKKPSSRAGQVFMLLSSWRDTMSRNHVSMPPVSLLLLLPPQNELVARRGPVEAREGSRPKHSDHLTNVLSMEQPGCSSELRFQ